MPFFADPAYSTHLFDLTNGSNTKINGIAYLNAGQNGGQTLFFVVR